MILGYDEWKTTPPDDHDCIEEKLSGPGYSEIGTNVFVSDGDAYEYAIERISQGTEEERKEFVEWFYSGNWIRED